MTTWSSAWGGRPATSLSEDSFGLGFQLNATVGEPWWLTALPSAPMRVTRPWTLGWASATPCTARTWLTTDSGTGTRCPPPKPPRPPVPYGATPWTTMSLPALTCWNSASKLCFTVSVSTNVPAMNATPSTMAMAVRNRRTLCAARLRRVARSTSVPHALHVVDDALGRRLRHLVDDAAVGEEHDAVRV